MIHILNKKEGALRKITQPTPPIAIEYCILTDKIELNFSDFTPCFHKTVLTWVPFAAIALSAPFEFLRYRDSRSRKIPRNWYNVLKFALTLCLVAIAIVDLVFLVVDKDDDEARNIAGGEIFILKDYSRD